MILFCTCTSSYTGFSTYFNHILFDTSYMSSSRLCVRVLSVNSCVWGLKWTTTGLSETLLLDSWDKCASRWWCLVFTTQSNQFCSKLVNNISFNQNKQKTNEIPVNTSHLPHLFYAMEPCTWFVCAWNATFVLLKHNTVTCVS